jgi:cation:H+ antiporter
VPHAPEGSGPHVHAGPRPLHWLALGAFALLPIAWMILHFGHWVQAPVPTALLSGIAIFGSAFLLSWGADVAQLDIPRALALALLALVAVLPEYAVDVYFAWRAGQDPTYTAYATANMTGANRLQIGLGWVLPLFVYCLRYKKTEVELPRGESIEIKFLFLACAYCFLLPIKGTLALYDTVVLFTLYFLYARAAAKTAHEEPELEGPPLTIASLGPVGRRCVAGALVLLAGAGILLAAEPFAESLVSSGRTLGIDEFLLVQWLAPLASEAPEFIIATLFALRGAATGALAIMISSGVNQFTLLIGALPAAFALSAGRLTSMKLDERQSDEVFLTCAQALFAVTIIADYKMSLVEAALLFCLFVPQLFFVSPQARITQATLFLVLAALWFAVRRWRIHRAGGPVGEAT